MQSPNKKKSPKKKIISNQLSKQAINYLDNQIINDGENKTIEVEFTFQIVYAMKSQESFGWYRCSLMDQNSKYGGFCIKYNKNYGEPKEGDIIKTKKIQIVKLPNRDSNIYFCEQVKKIEESKKMLVNPQKVESVAKMRSTSKKKAYLKYNLFQNYTEEDDDSNNINSPIKNNFIENGNQSLSESKNLILKEKKPTLVSEFTSFTNNPYFILKLIAKSEKRAFPSRFDKEGIGYVQNYIFSDINGDKIQGVSFDYNRTEELDKMLKIDSIYKISKASKKTNSSLDFAFTNCNIELLFSYNTLIEELEEEEKKGHIFKDKTEFTKINELVKKTNRVFDILGIVLDDKGIIERNKTNNELFKFRRLIIGDDTLHKVGLKLWGDLIEPNKLYLKGDIICIKDVKYKQWNYIYDLNSLFFTKIIYYGDTNQGKVLRKFYHNHQKSEEYKDINYIELESRKDIQNKFIIDYLNEYEKEQKINPFKLVKINAIVMEIEHSYENVFSGCKSCYKKFDDICPTCNTYNKKLYFDFIIKIGDCTNYMWVQLFGETAENFLGISPEDYQLLIKYNNKHKLNKINKGILYHEYTFIIRYINTSFDDPKGRKFTIVQYKKVDNEYFKKLIKISKSNL